MPEGTPADFYRIDIDIAGTVYASQSAVRVYDAYPSSWGFIQITDVHVGYEGTSYSSLERLQAFVREANFLNPEIVVVTGDICDNQIAGHDWPSQFLGAIAALEVPVYVVPGNHDYYNDGESYDPAGAHRYFTEINRFENSVVSSGRREVLRRDDPVRPRALPALPVPRAVVGGARLDPVRCRGPRVVGPPAVPSHARTELRPLGLEHDEHHGRPRPS